jgi:predicted MFS family arabinose efflux permease
MLGLILMTIARLLLTFIDSQIQLYIIMCTISPFGISIIFPCLVLGVKNLSNAGPMRTFAFNMFFASMVLGALLGGPIIDYIRRDVGKTQFEYLHTNAETGKMEKRYIEIS